MSSMTLAEDGGPRLHGFKATQLDPNQLLTAAGDRQIVGTHTKEGPMPKRRVACFIDGWNLTSAIRALGPQVRFFNWIDLYALAECYTDPTEEQLVTVRYFTASPYWNTTSRRLHKTYIAALKARGVETVLGVFRKRDRYCPKCQSVWHEHKEKETDVSIAVHITQGACQNEFDKVLLVSADSDLAPALVAARKEVSHIRIELLIPPKMRREAAELKKIADGSREIKVKRLYDNLLPQRVEGSEGTIVRPDEYRPPRHIWTNGRYACA